LISFANLAQSRHRGRSSDNGIAAAKSFSVKNQFYVSVIADNLTLLLGTAGIEL
jgi:hypothetical protein